MAHTEASGGAWIVAGALAAILSWLLTWFAIAYAHRRGMLDAPGRRRSHALPTPRGGGIGPIVVILVGGTLALWSTEIGGSLIAAWAVSLGLVALVGWGDDHLDLPVLPRLLVQALATLLFCAALIAGTGLSWWWLMPGLALGIWSINLHNFMDGIDGLLAMQVMFVAAVAAVVAHAIGMPGVSLTAWISVAACFGFWLHNRSPARIFMGDIGSGALGLLVFMLVALVSAREWRAGWVMLAVGSGFVIDAGLTLAQRMLRGRRWYTPHREHLYQWLVRCGWTHARTGRLYMLWNVLTLPFAWLAWHRPEWAPVIVLALYALGAWVWWRGRLACIRSAAGRVRRERA